MLKKFYVTTPIYYVNSDPHIGAAYTTIAADIFARWNRLIGNNVFFLTGTDEHGQKIQETAEKEGIKPKELVDKIAHKFEDTFKLLNISNDNFIRTTNKKHEEEVRRILQKLYDKKFVYKGEYESYYCIGCEQYLTKSDLVDGRCPLHKREPEIVKEESYMFKLSAFQDKLLKLVESGEYCILPIKRRNEVVSFIKSGLQDISISRKKSKVSWGIELPFDKEHTCYVWVDAFWNYLTGLIVKNKFEKFWPPDLQLMANDILRVHATIWPALLLSLKIKLPKVLFIHGYFTINGQKMSKSLGNVVSPTYLSNKYSVDSLRYFLFREIPFGGDGNFSEDALIARINNELANDLGNLISRILTLVETNFNSKIRKSKLDKKLTSKLDIKKIQFYVDKYELHNALNEIWRFVNECNKHVNEEKIWSMKKEVMEEHLYTILESIRVLSILLSPFIPNTSEEISKQLGVKLGTFKDCKFGLIKNYIVKKGSILFKKIEFKESNKSQSMEVSNMVKFDEWQKLDLRVGEIKEVKEHPNADKLVILKVDVGSKVIQLVAGLKKYYEIKNLVGRKVIVFTNLEPIELRGVKSEGMLLAAVDEKNDKVVFLTPEKDVSKGAKVR